MNTSAPAFDPANATCQRTLGRAALTLRSRLVTSSGNVICTVIDLSLGGARIEIERHLEIGETVWLTLGRVKVFGEIRWFNGRTAGIHFEKKLPKAVVLNLRGEAVNQQELAEIEAKMAARDWAEGTPPTRTKRDRLDEIIGLTKYGTELPHSSNPTTGRQGAAGRMRSESLHNRLAIQVITCSAVAGAIAGIISVLLT